MEFIDLIRTPNIDGVRLLDKNGQVDCQGKIAITGHQLLFVAREKELIMDHKMVDAVEKDTDKGRNLVKMRQKNGKLVRFLLNSQGEADDLCTSVQLCGMIKFTDTHPFYYNPPRSYEQLKKPNVLGTQVPIFNIKKVSNQHRRGSRRYETNVGGCLRKIKNLKCAQLIRNLSLFQLLSKTI